MTETPARWSAVVRTAGGSPESLSDGGGGGPPEMSGYQTTFRSFSIESLIGRDDENGGGRTRVESLITPSVNVDYQRRPGGGTPPAAIESMRTPCSPYDYYHNVIMNGGGGAEVLAANSPSSRRDIGLMQHHHHRLSTYFDGALPPPPAPQPDHRRHQDIDYFKVLQLQSAAAAAAAAAAIARKTFSLQRSAWPVYPSDVIPVTAALPQPLSFADDTRSDDGEDRLRGVSPGCAMASRSLSSFRPSARGFVRHDDNDDDDDDGGGGDGYDDDNDDDDDGGDGGDDDDDDNFDADDNDDHPSVNQRLSE